MPAPRVVVVHPAAGRDALRDALEAAGCRVRSVETATAAVATLATEPCDCLVTAFELPGDDGLTLRSAVRRLEPELPVVFVTDSDAIEQSVAADSENDRYIRKNGSDSLADLVAEVTAVQDDAEPADTEPTAEAELSADELRSTVETAPIGISLCDPSQADDPLVYVNDGWVTLTGYDAEAVLGRNPRLLQGPDTDPETTARLAEAIANEEQASVEIRNYRQDGTPFWNELTVAPIYDDGDLLQYVGFQVDITDRRAAEARADQRAEALAEERRSLRRLLDRINGLLREVSGVLVEATDRSQIEDGVCETIRHQQGYAASWIGQVESGGTGLRLIASSGLSAGTPESIPLAELPAAVLEALETDEPQRCSVADCDVISPAAEAQRLLVVPLCYGARRYGLLGVYGTAAGALDSRDQELFGALGEMVAHGLHAVETARLLTSDHVTELRIELRDASYLLSRIAAVIGSPVERCGTTNTDGDCELYLRTAAAAAAVDPERLTALESVEAARIVSDTDTELTVAVSLPVVSPDGLLAEFGAVVTAASATADRARLTVEAPPQQAVRSLLAALDSEFEAVELRARTDRAHRERDTHEFTTMVESRLTERQAAVLEAAHLNGYFESPRPVDGSEIASQLDITRQTFHQHLRTAEQKLVAAYMEAC